MLWSSTHIASHSHSPTTILQTSTLPVSIFVVHNRGLDILSGVTAPFPLTLTLAIHTHETPLLRSSFPYPFFPFSLSLSLPPSIHMTLLDMNSSGSSFPYPFLPSSLSLSLSLSLLLSPGCRPEIVDAPTEIIAVEGERVDFTLKVLGSPEPSVKWYYNGCEVGPNYATEISNDGGLTLVAAESKHKG